MTKPMIRHVAIYTKDTEALANFYTSVFDMQLMHVTAPGGGYHVTDGYFGFAILPERSINWLGIEHFGFLIEDTEKVAEKMVKAGGPAPEKRPPTRPFAEDRGHDIFGNPFDLSKHGYMRVEYAFERDQTAPTERPDGAYTLQLKDIKSKGMIRQLSFFAPDPAKLGSYYRDAFDLELVNAPEEKPATVHLTDGYVDVALMPSGDNDWVRGIHHIGIEIEDFDEIYWRLVAAGVPAPKPTGGAFGEYRCRDIFNNPFTISDKGYAVAKKHKQAA